MVIFLLSNVVSRLVVVDLPKFVAYGFSFGVGPVFL